MVEWLFYALAVGITALLPAVIYVLAYLAFGQDRPPSDPAARRASGVRMAQLGGVALVAGPVVGRIVGEFVESGFLVFFSALVLMFAGWSGLILGVRRVLKR